MPRTSRTGALRAVSAACAATPPVIGLPLLFGAFLAALWVFLAAPAQAETHTDGDGLAVTETLSQDEAPSRDGELDLGEARTLERVVPEEVTDPVTGTLDTVHRGLEDTADTADTAAAATGLPEPTCLAEVGDDVRGEVRDVVQEIDRTREEAVGEGLAPALPVTEPGQPGPSTTEEAESGPEESAADTEDAQSTQEPEAETGPTGPEHASAPIQHHRPVSAAAIAAPVESADPADRADRADRAPDHYHAPSTAGSAAPTANGPAPAPAVAGYLNSALLPAPVTDAAPVTAHGPHPVPADPADDPTVSPD